MINNCKKIYFLGDSITAADKYTRIIVDWCVRNFPDIRHDFKTFGIYGADIKAFISIVEEKDIFNKADVVTFLFGVNDLKRSLYSDSAKVNLQLLEKREKAFLTFCDNSHLLSDMFEGAERFWITPSVHNESELIGGGKYSGFNAALARAAEFLKNEYNAVDVFSILDSVQQKYLVTDEDRVHPNNVGQTLIAFEFIKNLGYCNIKLPMWDPEYKEDEKNIIKSYGIDVDNRVNPYSQLRCDAEQKYLYICYVKNFLLPSIDIKEDTEDDYIKKYLLTKNVPDLHKKILPYYLQHKNEEQYLLQQSSKFLQKMYDWELENR